MSQTPAQESPGGTGLDDREATSFPARLLPGKTGVGLSIATEEVVLLFNEL